MLIALQDPYFIVPEAAKVYELRSGVFALNIRIVLDWPTPLVWVYLAVWSSIVPGDDVKTVESLVNDDHIKSMSIV